MKRERAGWREKEIEEEDDGKGERERGWRGREKEDGRKEIFYLTTHLTHFNYGYMASEIW